jgi:putative MATE family efflux protein
MKDNKKMLGCEPIGKLLTRLSVPAMLGMIVNALYNLADTIFIGRFVGTKALGGLAIAFPIQMLMGGFGLMVGMGAASAISRFLGARQDEKANHTAGNAFLSVWILGIIFMMVGVTFIDPVLNLFGATENILPFAKEYMRIIFFGSVFLTTTMVANNIVRSEGNAKTAMIAMMIGTGTNLILDPLFIIGFDMGISGAATATVTSQFLGFCYVAFYFLRGKSSLNINLAHFKPKIEMIKEIFLVGFPTFTRNVAGSLLAIVANNALAVYGGDLAISVFGIMNRLSMFVLMPMFGFVQGFQPIAGFNFGAKQYSRLKEVIKVTLSRMFIYGAIGCLLIEIFPQIFVGLFTNDSELITMGSKVLRLFFLSLPFVCIQILSSSLFQSMGKALPALLVSTIRQTLLLIPMILILPKIFNLGLNGVWLAFPISDLFAILISGLMLFAQHKEISRLQSLKEVKMKCR